MSAYGVAASEWAVTNIYGFATASSSPGGNAEIIGSVAIPRMMDDPLFGLTYSPGHVRFEAAPASIGQSCPSLRGRQLWTYAKWEERNRQYWIVSGFVAPKPESAGNQPRNLEPDATGIAVELRGSECRVGTPAITLSGKAGRDRGKKPIEASRKAREGLASDALRRYALAFGGQAQFLQELARQRIDRAKVPPVLRAQLNRSSM